MEKVAGHLLPCFQSLLPEGSICRAARLLSEIGQSLVQGSLGGVEVVSLLAGLLLFAFFCTSSWS